MAVPKAAHSPGVPARIFLHSKGRFGAAVDPIRVTGKLSMQSFRLHVPFTGMAGMGNHDPAAAPRIVFPQCRT
jgi:hypothetical protein